MNPLVLGPLLEFGKSILDRFVEDPTKKREMELEVFKMAAEGELKQIIADEPDGAVGINRHNDYTYHAKGMRSLEDIRNKTAV